MELDRSGSALDIQELLSVRERIDTLLANQHEGTQPRADLIDVGDSYRLLMEVPGLREENLEIALDDQDLLVAGIRDDYSQEVEYIMNERQTGPFQRSFHLPEPVDGTVTSAHLQQGLLVVVIPKSR